MVVEIPRPFGDGHALEGTHVSARHGIPEHRFEGEITVHLDELGSESFERFRGVDIRNGGDSVGRSPVDRVIGLDPRGCGIDDVRVSVVAGCEPLDPVEQSVPIHPREADFLDNAGSHPGRQDDLPFAERGLRRHGLGVDLVSRVVARAFAVPGILADDGVAQGLDRLRHAGHESELRVLTGNLADRSAKGDAEVCHVRGDLSLPGHDLIRDLDQPGGIRERKEGDLVEFDAALVCIQQPDIRVEVEYILQDGHGHPGHAAIDGSDVHDQALPGILVLVVVDDLDHVASDVVDGVSIESIRIEDARPVELLRHEEIGGHALVAPQDEIEEVGIDPHRSVGRDEEVDGQTGRILGELLIERDLHGVAVEVCVEHLGDEGMHPHVASVVNPDLLHVGRCLVGIRVFRHEQLDVVVVEDIHGDLRQHVVIGRDAVVGVLLVGILVDDVQDVGRRLAHSADHLPCSNRNGVEIDGCVVGHIAIQAVAHSDFASRPGFVLLLLVRLHELGRRKRHARLLGNRLWHGVHDAGVAIWFGRLGGRRPRLSGTVARHDHGVVHVAGGGLHGDGCAIAQLLLRLASEPVVGGRLAEGCEGSHGSPRLVLLERKLVGTLDLVGASADRLVRLLVLLLLLLLILGRRGLLGFVDSGLSFRSGFCRALVRICALGDDGSLLVHCGLGAILSRGPGVLILLLAEDVGVVALRLLGLPGSEHKLPRAGSRRLGLLLRLALLYA